ncbi:MAG: hypothetical protein H0T42_04500 [Deltaproteobacteria bacterium]|nr:hypothetical protein [Deltaproteobacteria bacterium]
MRLRVIAAVLVLAATVVAAAPPPGAGHPPAAAAEFTQAALALFAVGACGEASAPAAVPATYLTKHCTIVNRAQEDYRAAWVVKAKPFFADKVPSTVPKKVVYPFAGGDLSTALTVYPDADEITTLSLEPAGDPRTLEGLAVPATNGKAARMSPALERAMQTIRDELRFLYKVNFSNTMNMISAMRSGALPTQLVFGLSALKIHGFEIVGLRYFTLTDTGAISYLTPASVAAAPPVTARADSRNRVFANAELQFKKPGGRVQIYRHIQANLDDTHTKKDPRVLAHLRSKGAVAGMTKAASYLLSWPEFSNIRSYLLENVVWMVSDATGVPPKFGKPAGFEYETYGAFKVPHISAGKEIAKNWRDEWDTQTRRDLRFRFGYYDGSRGHTSHLVIMRKM